MIDIKSIRNIDQEEDLIELNTTGTFAKVEGKYYITYKEYDSNNPRIYKMCIVKIDAKGKVELIKNGVVQTKLILEKDERHYCPYNTEHGTFIVGIYTECVEFSYSENCGELLLKYSIDINSVSAGTNEVSVKFRKIDNYPRKSNILKKTFYYH